MREFSTNRSAPYLARHRVLAATLAIAVLASLGFVAAGGIKMVKSWFVTTTVNDQVIDTREVVPDGKGEATFTLPVGNAAKTEVTVQSDGAAGGGQKRVEVNVQGGEATVQIKQEKANSGK